MRSVNVYFDTDAVGPVTVSNPWMLNYKPDAEGIDTTPGATISFWGMGPGLADQTIDASPLTLDGRIEGAGGLVLQGHATGDDRVSEIVLAGPMTARGAPRAFSYGTDTQVQNFVNGPGGITLGVTGYVGASPVAADFRVDSPEAAGSAIDGALGFVRFGDAAHFQAMTTGPGYFAAIRRAQAEHEAHFGYLLTGSEAGASFSAPAGKSFVIGSLGEGQQVGGTLGSTGIGVNTAVLADTVVNIHANSVADPQRLTLLARRADDRFVLGTLDQPVVFRPTYGDSGATTSMTELCDRRGLTTLTTAGAGTVEVRNVQYTAADGSDARSRFAWSVDMATVLYNQDDSQQQSLATLEVNGGGTLAGHGVIVAPVVVNAGGILQAGDAATPGLLTIKGPLTLAGTTVFRIGDAVQDRLAGIHQLTFGGALSVQSIGSPAYEEGQVFDLFDFIDGAETTFASITLPLLPDGLSWKRFGASTFDYATGQIAIEAGGNVGPMTRVWNGATSGAWSLPGNWVGGGAPSPGDTIVFAGVEGLQPENDVAGFEAAGLEFAADAGAFRLAGERLVVTGPITNNALSPQEIALDIELSGSNAGEFNTAADSLLTLLGETTGDVGVVKNGPGSLTIMQPKYTGDTLVNEGVLELHGLSGDGATVVGAGETVAVLKVDWIIQNSLTIGANGTVEMLPSGASVPIGGDDDGDGSNGGAPIPEPATVMLMLIFALASMALSYRRRLH
jgi:autotransporter-associated beta strand protein